MVRVRSGQISSAQFWLAQIRLLLVGGARGGAEEERSTRNPLDLGSYPGRSNIKMKTPPPPLDVATCIYGEEEGRKTTWNAI